MEFYGSRDEAAIEVNMHYADTNDEHDQMGATVFSLEKGIFSDDFHVFELEWNEEEFIWQLDEKELMRKSIAEEQFACFHKEFFILLNLAVGGKYSGRPDTTTTFPQCMYVDWVRVYQKMK